MFLIKINGRTTVELIDNTILVKIIAIESNINSETIDNFKKNKVSLENNIIPIDILLNE